ncbi:RTA1 like protein-domain-containing protein [Truncatella angustata]|uniref:RTA1 like protein-domain-containing protein n=1 Tax=Truncatella angustata TaxID=152316 RepID=A0A9P8ZX58_9PEZI|nr:RTA1 like protein-domain-containing protein [Truncatella angustata]KAH6652669.1 RTA1 like protein-domain-containing protein [Truncatella angustata]KAH8196977.1 hypothetical protein TruAng_008871 [Truncatella angustata]
MASSGDCDRNSCSYGFLQYEPSLAGNVVLLAFFAILIPIALFLGFRYQSLIFAVTITTGLSLEIIGYVGRLLARSNKNNKADFILFQLGTLLAPIFISLAVFRLMPPIVAAYGDRYRAWRPAWHNIVFYAFSAVCIVLQTIGSVLSMLADTKTSNDIGIRLLVAGLAIHISSLFIFTILGVRFALAVRQRKGGWDRDSIMVYKTPRFKSFIIGLSIAAILLIARTAYRMIAVAEGLASTLAQDEVLFLVLDGALMLVTIALLLALFPGRVLGASQPDNAAYAQRTSQKSINRPAPIQLERNFLGQNRNRVSLKSSAANTPKTSPKYSPRKSNIPPPPARRNMVDSEQLW